jgi:hypothetical protein
MRIKERGGGEDGGRDGGCRMEGGEGEERTQSERLGGGGGGGCGGGGGLSFGTDSRACVGVVRSVFLVVAVSSLLDQ